MRTVAWVYEREAEQPAPPPPPPPPGAAAAPSTGGPDPEPELDLDGSQPPAYSDEWLALGFIAQYGDRLRYVAAWSQWFGWDGRVWSRDTTLRVFSRIKLFLRQLAANCRKHRLAMALADARTVAAVERMIRPDRRVAATVKQWDRHQHLLNTPAGMVDLRTGQVRPHRAEDYATKITAVAPGGDCPLWLKFLDRITGQDKDLQAFLQRMAGYSLTGSTDEHALFFLFGGGSNGKSVFVSTLAGMLSSYATVAAIETFTASVTDQHPCDLAKLHGARLVTAQETADGRRWAESKLKMMTGGDTITARFMRQDFFDFEPIFKLMIAGNHKPGLRSVGEAIRRRVHLLPFTVTIPPAERDRKLARKLKAEWPGILAWAMAGCLEWQRIGLAPPAAVTAATQEYFAGEDVIQAWIDECCENDKAKAAYAPTLYSSFKAWAELAGEFIASRRWLTAALADRGYEQKREGRHGIYRKQQIIIGLVLKSGSGTVPP